MSYAKLGMAAFGAAAAYGLSRGRGRRAGIRLGSGPHSIDTPEGEFIDNASVTIGQDYFIPNPEDGGGAMVYKRLSFVHPYPDDEVFTSIGSVLAITDQPDDFLGRITPGSLRGIIDWWGGYPNDLVRDRGRRARGRRAATSSRTKLMKELWSSKHPDYRSDKGWGRIGIMIGPAAHDHMGWEGSTAVVYLDSLSDSDLRKLHSYMVKPKGSSARGRRVMAAGSSRRKKTEKVPADTGYSRKGKFQAEYGMNFLRGNREPYFSITGTGYAPNGREVSGGQLHGMVRRYFPKLRPLIKWHLFSPSSGPMHYRPNAKYWAREGHKAHFKSTVVWGALPSDKSADVGKIMSKDPAALDRWLKLRLPKLRAGFKRDMKAAGISWD